MTGIEAKFIHNFHQTFIFTAFLLLLWKVIGSIYHISKTIYILSVTSMPYSDTHAGSADGDCVYIHTGSCKTLSWAYTYRIHIPYGVQGGGGGGGGLNGGRRWAVEHGTLIWRGNKVTVHKTWILCSMQIHSANLLFTCFILTTGPSYLHLLHIS